LDSWTQGALVWWRRIFAIPKRAYTSLRQICQARKWFNADHIPLWRNLRAFEQERFAPLPLYTVKVPSNVDPEEGEEREQIDVPFHDLFDVLRRLVQFPGNLETMKSGAVHQDDFANQAYHGAIARESPLYTFPSFNGANGKEFFLNDDVNYVYDNEEFMGRVVAICAVDDGDAMYIELCKTKTIPQALADLRAEKKLMCRIRPYRSGTGDGVVLLDFDTQHCVLDLQSVHSKVHVAWPKPPASASASASAAVVAAVAVAAAAAAAAAAASGFRCTHGLVTTRRACDAQPTQQERPVDECPLLPVRAFALDPAALVDHEFLPTLRVFLIYYYDDFGTYNKVHHSSGGCYLTLGNLPYWQQVKLHNIIPLLVKPPNADKRACHAIFNAQAQELQRGVVINCGPVLGDIYFVGGVAIGRFDMPEGNDAAGVKRQNANCGCRRCYVVNGSLDKFDEECADRSYELDLRARTQADEAPSAAARDRVLKESGLHIRHSLFRDLAMDPYRQCPHDPFHMECMGLAKNATTDLCKVLRPEAITAINAKIERFQLPAHWQRRLPIWKLNSKNSSKAGSLKYTGGNLKRFMQLAGLVFKDNLRVASFKPSAITKFETRLGQDWLNMIVRSFVGLGKINRELFRWCHGDADTSAEHIRRVVIEGRKRFVNVWGPLTETGYSETPNVHAAVHYAETHIDFGGNRLANCERSETKHGPLRRVVHNTNHRNLEVDMMEWSRITNGIDFLSMGGGQHMLGHTRDPGPEFFEFLQDPVIRRMTCASTDNRTMYEGDEDDMPANENKVLVFDRCGTEFDVDTDFRTLMRECPTESVRGAATSVYPDLKVFSYKSIQLVKREAWRAKLYKGGFFSLKGSSRLGPVLYCRDLFEFRMVGSSVEQMALMECAEPTGTRCEVTGFPFFKLGGSSALVRAIDIDSPVHVVHACAEDCGGVCGEGEHDVEGNPLFLFNETFFK
jgi:hypothetical protein